MSDEIDRYYPIHEDLYSLIRPTKEAEPDGMYWAIEQRENGQYWPVCADSSGGPWPETYTKARSTDWSRQETTHILPMS